MKKEFKITDINVEGIKKPVGVDEKKPVFSWRITGNEKNIFQESYRIIVKSGSDFFGETVFDSKTVKSGRTTGIEYRGKPLIPDTKYSFKIICVINGKTVESEISEFSTGLLGTEMQGKWITTEKNGNADPETCAFARKTFSASDIDYATLFICSYGWYELYINGIRPDSRILSPSKGIYDYLMFYEAYDITDLLESGKNAVSLVLGDGYNLNANVYMGKYNGAKRFKACINLHKTDGSVERIVSDETWKFTLDTPFISNNIYNGEIYDASKENKEWLYKGYDDSEWNRMFISPLKEKAKLYCDIGPFIKINETLNPKKIYKCNDGRYIFDFGQNMSGFVKINLKGERGTRIRIKTAERIKEFDGEYILDTETNRAAASTDTYIFSGNGIESYCPHFTYHGFRYAEITGLNETPIKGQITACVVHTESESFAYFKTDNEMINRIYKNALWSVRSNSFSFPSDCAARDERTPCPMDLFCYLKTAMYMRSPDEYYLRFLKYLYSDKKYAPRFNMTWDGCMIAIPWYYMAYNSNIIPAKRYYSKMKVLIIKYLNKNNGKIPLDSFGDWCAPNEEGDYLTSFSSVGETEYYMRITVCRMMADMAEKLGKTWDFEFFTEKAISAENAYKKEYFKNGVFSSAKQSPNLYALSLDILNEKEKAITAKKLKEEIVLNGNHLDVGIFGIPHFFEVLSNLDAADSALECFLNPDYPSFANQINRGATTLWEQWCGKGDMSSNNHAMFAGAINGFFTRLAGIVPLENGFEAVRIKPVITKYIKKLDLKFDSVKGKYEINYKMAGGEFFLSVNIPPNTKAEIELPNGEIFKVGNGKFEFKCGLQS